MHWFWKKKRKDSEKPIVIDDTCYQKLHPELQNQFYKPAMQGLVKPNHRVSIAKGRSTGNTFIGLQDIDDDSDTSYSEGLIIGSIINDVFTHVDNSIVDNTPEQDFGGGSGGGAGAGNRYTPDTPQYDPGSSPSFNQDPPFDPGPSQSDGSSFSFDSSSSDSGSSSFDSGSSSGSDSGF